MSILKKAIISCDMHLPNIKQILNLQATQNRIITQNWKDLAAAILETGPQLQWQTCWKKRKQGTQNNEIELEVLIFPKINL